MDIFWTFYLNHLSPLWGYFFKTMFMRDMVPITDLSTQNCLYEAWLHQISNSDFMYNPDSGEPYSPLDLRMQLLYNMAVDHENYYPQVKMHLEIPYKLWIMKQISEQTPSDMVAVAGLRHMFQVSTNLKLFLLFFRPQEDVPWRLSSLIPAMIPIRSLIPYQIPHFLCCACT